MKTYSVKVFYTKLFALLPNLYLSIFTFDVLSPQCMIISFQAGAIKFLQMKKISYFLIFECFNPIENSEVLGFFWALSKFFVILNQDHVICYNQYHIELMLSIQSQEEPWAIITIVFIFRHASVSRTYPGTYNRQDPHITARIHNITARILI